MRAIKFAIVLMVLIIGWLIGWSNATSVSFAFLDWHTPELPVYIFYCLFLTAGLLTGLILGRFSARR